MSKPSILISSALFVAAQAAVARAQVPASPPPQPTEAQSAPECRPSCRSGFVCLHGQCISACNPPCGADQICTASAECVPPAAPPPIAYPAAAYPPATTYPTAAPPPGPLVLTLPDPGAHKHDGVFLRVQVGLSETLLAPAPGTTLAGVGSALDFVVGRIITPNLAVGGALTHSAAGVSHVDGTNPPDLNAILLGFGPAAVYYLLGNFFVGAAAGGSAMWLRDLRPEGADISWGTSLGVFAKAEFGKEWWVSDNWGLGASFRLHYMRAKESDVGPFAPVWNGGGLSLLFSATYN
jgi:hypothetical protein